MSDYIGIGAALAAVFHPVPDEHRKPVHKSRSIKEAMQRMGDEADALKEAAVGDIPPFCGTIKSISDRM